MSTVAKPFQFTAASDHLKIVYTYTPKNDVSCEVSWLDNDGNKDSTSYSIEIVKRLIREGEWVVMPSVESIETKPTLDDFANEHDVVLVTRYEIYSPESFSPYVANTEEEARKIIEAVAFLNSVREEIV